MRLGRMALANSEFRPTGCTGTETGDPTSDQSATRPVSRLHGSSGPTPASGSRGDATRAIPSGTPILRNSRTGSPGTAGVPEVPASAGVAGAGTGVACNLTAVAGAGAAGTVGVASVPGTSLVRES